MTKLTESQEKNFSTESPEDFKLINRASIVLIPKQPFLDWIRTVERSKSKDDLWLNDLDIRKDRNVYLIDELESDKELEEYLKDNFEKFFLNELNDWYTDTELWPKDITFEMFREWLDIEFHSMVHDTLKTNLEKETL